MAAETISIGGKKQVITEKKNRKLREGKYTSLAGVTAALAAGDGTEEEEARLFSVGNASSIRGMGGVPMTIGEGSEGPVGCTSIGDGEGLWAEAPPVSVRRQESTRTNVSMGNRGKQKLKLMGEHSFRRQKRERESSERTYRWLSRHWRRNRSGERRGLLQQVLL